MAYTQVGVGTVANDNTGDPIRDAFVKVNANFTTLDGLVADNATLVITANDIAGATDVDITLSPAGTLGHVVINDDRINISTTMTPADDKGVSGDTAGDIAWDATYLYVCHTTWTDGVSAIWTRNSAVMVSGW